MMLKRTLLLTVVVVAVSTLFLTCTSSSVVADEKKFTFDVGNTIVLGQSHGDRKGPSLFDRFRQWGNKLLQDDNHDSGSYRPPVVAPPATTIQPPKPPTAAEVKESIAMPGQGQQGQRVTTSTANTTPPRGGTMATSPGNNTDEGDNESDGPILDRMKEMREMVFNQAYPELMEAARVSRQASSSPVAASLVPSPTTVHENNAGILSNNVNDIPPVTSVPVLTEHTGTTLLGSALPLTVPNQPNQQNQMPPQLSPSQQAAQRVAELDNIQQRRETAGTRRITSASPRLDFEVEEPPRVVINQEITHRIRVTNIGDAPAEEVVVKTELPSWIDVRHTDTDNGTVVAVPREDGSGITDLVWKMNRINQGATHIFVLRSVPQQRLTIEFPIQFHFRPPAIMTRVEVQEPRLEMELIGAEEVLWKDDVVYTLVVRNVGTGDAENIRLDLQQTNSESNFCEFPEPLPPGGYHEIPIQVRAGREQEHIEIAVSATGAHDLKGEVRRRIRVLRPKLDIIVQTMPLHFVESMAEVTIRVRNVGTADEDNALIRAELPLGAQYERSNESGIATIRQQQNLVEWRGKSIPKGQMETFTLVCRPQREGECRVSAEVSEPSGTVLIAGNVTFMAKAVVDLDLEVLKPNGPVELGKEAEYTVQLTNKGTKAAEDVVVSMMLGKQLEPVAVRGGDANHSEEDGQVLFEKIPVILPKQTLELVVIAKAEQLGTAQVRTEVNGADIHLTKGLSTYIFSQMTTASAQTQSEVLR